MSSLAVIASQIVIGLPNVTWWQAILMVIGGLAVGVVLGYLVLALVAWVWFELTFGADRRRSRRD